jgi:hypothetical protein
MGGPVKGEQGGMHNMGGALEGRRYDMQRMGVDEGIFDEVLVRGQDWYQCEDRRDGAGKWQTWDDEHYVGQVVVDDDDELGDAIQWMAESYETESLVMMAIRERQRAALLDDIETPVMRTGENGVECQGGRRDGAEEEVEEGEEDGDEHGEVEEEECCTSSGERRHKGSLAARIEHEFMTPDVPTTKFKLKLTGCNVQTLALSDDHSKRLAGGDTAKMRLWVEVLVEKQIDFFAMSESRVCGPWIGEDETKRYRLFFSSLPKTQKRIWGVGLGIRKGDWFAYKGHAFISPRLMYVHGEAYGQPICVIVVYAPAHSQTNENHKAEREALFNLLEKTIKEIPARYREWCVVIGDFNGRIGPSFEYKVNGETREIVGDMIASDEQDDAGEYMVNLCIKEDLVVANSFATTGIQVGTWRRPGDKGHYYVTDYILIPRKLKRMMVKCMWKG